MEGLPALEALHHRVDKYFGFAVFVVDVFGLFIYNLRWRWSA